MLRFRQSHILALMALILLTTFAVSYLWEHGVEELVSLALGWPYDAEFEDDEKWRFILTSVGFSAISLTFPTILLIAGFGRLKATYGKLVEAQSTSEALARHDPLTGLSNRRVFVSELDRRISGLAGDSAPFAVFFFDIDHFKETNDVFGHGAGDAVLCATSDRLQHLVRNAGLAARVGGDEFSVILPAEAGVQDAATFARRAITQLSKPILFDEKEVPVSLSVGIALATSAANREQLLRSADIALYRAKSTSRGNFQFFDQSMEDEITARRELEQSILQSIDANDFVPFYQPLVRMSDGALDGFEALARWQHPTAGILPPAMFIAAATEMGVLTALAQGVFRQACRDAALWPPHLVLSFNISPSELKDPHLVQRMFDVLDETGLDPTRLEIEITEDAVLADVEVAKEFLKELRGKGIRTALDDFGTGYSSLSTLRDLKFEKIKIDRSFAGAAEGNAEARQLLDTIIYLGQSLGMETTAEGIETPENAEHIAEKNCTYGQGYLFGKPMPAHEAAAYIQNEGSVAGSLIAMRG